MPDDPAWRFVSERIEPLGYNASLAATGGPCLPTAFTWRGEERRVLQCLCGWATDGADRGNSVERYIRRHWFEVELDGGELAKLYVLRQPQAAGGRWFLHSVRTARTG